MSRPRRRLEFGIFPVPAAAGQSDLLHQVCLADELGLDVVGIQDHPYQRRHLDTFTLLPWLAASTDQIRFFPDVAHLPLRSPAMLAKAVASLDVLSGGRVELGLGAGAFPGPSQAMGAPSRTPAETVAALGEAITLIRQFWAPPRDGVWHDGDYYQLGGVQAGPPPVHDVGIWVGAGGPKMLKLVATMADGWITPGTEHHGLPDLLTKRDTLERHAVDAGRDPSAIRRIIDVPGVITDGPATAWLHGPVEHWVEELSGLADERFDTFIFWPDQSTDDQFHAFAEVARTLARRR